ncbi:MAG: hypothetical protein EAZ67_04175 [Cytophagales bacterium]|nr:MAG: hypothetical protein EAZ67_04175 [Cytophagales bacterium]
MRFSNIVPSFLLIFICFGFYVLSHQNALAQIPNLPGGGKTQPIRADSTKQAETADQTNPSTSTNPTDTTKLNNKADSVFYGPHTTFFIYESDLLYDIKEEHRPDTTIFGLHRYNVVQSRQNTWQDLGIQGTASSPIFYSSPQQIGTRNGFQVYEPYIMRAQDRPFYNTRSPYTQVKLLQGGQGRARINVDFARNVTPNAGFAIYYQRTTANFVVGTTFRRNDPIITHQSVGASSRIFAFKNRYKLLTSFFYHDHNVTETGGYTIEDIEVNDLDTLFLFENAALTPRLNNNKHIQTGFQARLFQQLALIGKGIQLYHIADYSTQNNTFYDRNTVENVAFYDSVYFNPKRESVFYRHKWRCLDNTAGVKGRFGGFQYRFYLRNRSFNNDTRFTKNADMLPQTPLDTLIESSIPTEVYAGGGLRYDLNEQSAIKAELEYLLASDYRLQVQWHHPKAFLSIRQQAYAPDLVQRTMLGLYAKWDNDFKNQVATQLEAAYQFDVLGFRLKPSLELSRVGNMVYYSSTLQSKQANEAVQFFSLGFNGEKSYKQWHFQAMARYTRASGADVWRVPTFLTNILIYNEKKYFNDVVHAQIGVDLHYKTAYRGNAYSVALGQFVLQDNFQVAGVLLADVFMNFKISRFITFFKINNLGQGLTSPGYFDTPFYMGQPRSVEIGIKWLFFD